MQPRAVFAFALLLAAALVAAAPSGSGLATNAEGGTFSSARRYWFSVGPRERLRLVLDGSEVYRGAGPASAELAAKEGEERRYELVAERLQPAPDDSLIESRTFLVAVDAAPPKEPIITASRRPDGWTLSVRTEERSRVDAIVAADGVYSLRRDLSDGEVVAGRSLSVLAWAVDAAGNRSEVVTAEAAPLELAVANPAAGRWANRQRLVVFADGAEEVFWTDDGSDPLGPSSHRYGGPVLIDAVGDVLVKVAARARDGRIERREVAYSVAQADETPFENLRAAEEKSFTAASALTLPEGFRWDAASALPPVVEASDLRYESRTIALRPVANFARAYVLLIGDRSVPRRFAFALDGRLPDAADPAVGAPASVDDADADTEVEAAATVSDSMPLLRTAGIARAIQWPRIPARIRYRLGEEARWNDADEPLCIPAAGGRLAWITEGETETAGPFFMDIGPTEGFSEGPLPTASRSDGAVVAETVRLATADGRESARFYVTLPGAVPSRIMSLAHGTELALDACDGESLVWSIRPERGGPPRSWTIDRAPPRRPRIEGPEEGAWISRAAEVSVIGEDRTYAVVRRAASADAAETFNFIGTTLLRPTREGLESIRIEARSVDEAGNESPIVVRSFTMDASTVYAGILRRDPEAAGDGSRDQPFASLDEAAAAAKARGLRHIRVLSGAGLKGPTRLDAELRIEGGYRSDGTAYGGQARITAEAGAYLLVSGAEVELSALSIEGAAGSAAPLVRAEGGARVVMKGCDLTGGGLVLDASSAAFDLTECRVVASGAGLPRSAAIRADNSTISLDRCRLEVSGADVAVALDCRGGEITLDTVIAEIRGGRTAFGFLLREATVRAEDAAASAVADDYASALDIGRSAYSWKGGSLAATARDAALATIDASEGSFAETGFTVSAVSSARAFRISGEFPSIADSVLTAASSAKSADAFSGAEPRPGSVGGNRFRGFDRLWGARFEAADIAAFNRRYAPRGSPNTVIDPEDGE